MNFNPLPVIIILIVFAIVFTWVRFGGSKVRQRPDYVQRLIYEIRLNQALVETFRNREKPRKFETTTWRMFHNEMDFLEDSLQENLSDVFDIILEYNEQIQAAKKTRTYDQLNINVNKIKKPLAICRKELEDWLEETTGNRELPTRYPGMFGWWFGRSS